MNKLKASVLSLSLLTVMSGAAVAPALGTISNYFTDVPQTLIKLIITLPALMIILTSSLFSFFIAKMTPKKITMIGLILYLIGGTFAGFVNNIYLILIFRILLGVGVGLIMPLSTAFISVLFDKEEQSKLMGYSSAMNNLGGIIATSLSGILVAINWRFSFLIYLMGILVILLIIFNLPNVRFHDHSDVGGTSARTNLDARSFRLILPYALIMFMIMVIFYALPSNFSMINAKSSLVPVSAIGIIMSIQNLAAFITGIFLSRILGGLKKLSPYLSVALLAFGFLLESNLTNVVATMLGLIFIGLGLGVMVPILNSQIALHIERPKIASAMSVMSAFLFLGQFLSPIILDTIINVTNLKIVQAPYYLATIISLILLIIMIFMPLKINTDFNRTPLK